MKKYARILCAVIICLLACMTGMNIFAAQNEQEEVVEFNYTVLDSSQLTIPQTQKILVSIGELGAQKLSAAQLVIRKEATGEKTVTDAEQISEDAVLFSISYKDDMQKGTYILESIVCTYDGTERNIVYDTSDIIKFAVNEKINTTPDDVIIEDVTEEADIIRVGEQENLTSEALEAVLGQNETETDSVFTSSRRGAKKSSKIIVLDPGHGGTDGGACANNLKEKDLNLKIATYCKEELEKYTGIKVYMTRTGDTYPTLDERVSYATSVNADLFVSFHINSFYSSSAAGAEVYYPNGNYKPELGTEGKGLAEAVLKKLVELGLKDRGVKYLDSSSYTYPDGSKADAYAVIRGAKNAGYAGILIEHAFISNPSEAQTYLGSDAALKKLGVADAQGIVGYYGLKLKTAGDDNNDDDDEPGEAKIVKLTAKNAAKVTVQWSGADDAAGYRVYRSNKLNGTYTNIALIENPQTFTYQDSTVKPGKTYYYKVSYYNAKKESGLSEAASIKILKTPDILSVKRSRTALKITWKKLKNAENYQIFRSTSKDGKYQRIKTVSAKSNYYVDTSVKSGKKYYYKIRAYALGVDGKSYSAYSLPKGKAAK